MPPPLLGPGACRRLQRGRHGGSVTPRVLRCPTSWVKMGLSRTNTLSASFDVPVATKRQEGFDLEAFHAGDRDVLTQIYRTNVARVERAVLRYLRWERQK